MKLCLNIDGILTSIEIKNYHKSTQENWYNEWCKISFSFVFNNIFNYEKFEDELLMCSEVEMLRDTIKKLLYDEIKQTTELSFIEPDFCFIFNPKHIDQQISLFEERPRIIDADAEWKVFFWNDGLTENYLSMCLNSQDIEYLMNYLNLVTGVMDKSNPVIEDMINKGILCE